MRPKHKGVNEAMATVILETQCVACKAIRSGKVLGSQCPKCGASVSWQQVRVVPPERKEG